MKVKDRGETRKNRYSVVVCNIFRVVIFEKWFYFGNFRFLGKIPFSRSRLNIYFRGSLISSKHFLTTLRFISSYPELLFALMRRKPTLVHLLITSFLPFEEFGVFLG